MTIKGTLTDEACWSAEDLRRMLSCQTSNCVCDAESFLPTVGGGLSVNIAPGSGAVVAGWQTGNTVTQTEPGNPGAYPVCSTGNETVNISPNSSTATRVDCIVIRVRDAAYPDGGTPTGVTLEVVEGIPGGGPPTLPLSTMKIATVEMPPGATSVAADQLTDSRRLCDPIGRLAPNDPDCPSFPVLNAGGLAAPVPVTQFEVPSAGESKPFRPLRKNPNDSTELGVEAAHCFADPISSRERNTNAWLADQFNGGTYLTHTVTETAPADCWMRVAVEWGLCELLMTLSDPTNTVLNTVGSAFGVLAEADISTPAGAITGDPCVLLQHVYNATAGFNAAGTFIRGTVPHQTTMLSNYVVYIPPGGTWSHTTNLIGSAVGGANSSLTVESTINAAIEYVERCP